MSLKPACMGFLHLVGVFRMSGCCRGGEWWIGASFQSHRAFRIFELEEAVLIWRDEEERFSQARKVVFKRSEGCLSHQYFSLYLDEYRLVLYLLKQPSLKILSFRNLTASIILIETFFTIISTCHSMATLSLLQAPHKLIPIIFSLLLFL